MTTRRNLRSVGTHDGTFHADEVTACALLMVFDLVDFDQIYRTRDQQVLDACEYVCDVGGIYDSHDKRFDHHQSDYQGPLSSAGMVLEYLMESGVLSSKEHHHMQDFLIGGVDAHDNGQMPQFPGVCTFSHVVGNFMPIRHGADAETLLAAFHEALQFVLGHLSRLRERYAYMQTCAKVVAERMAESQECMVFDLVVTHGREAGFREIELFFG